MATIQYVVNAVDAASATFERIAGSADQLLKELDDIGKKSVAARVGLNGDKEMGLTLDKLDLKMANLGKKVAMGKVGVEGQARAILQIRALEASLDKLDGRHVTATVEVNTRGGLLRRLGGLFGGGGGGAVAGGRAANAGGNALGGVLSSVPVTGQAIGIGAAAALGAVVAPAAIPAALGLGAGGLGLVLTQAKGLQTVLADILKTLKTAAAPLKGVFGDILKNFDQFVKSQGPGLRDLFKASLPFLNAFVKVLEQAGKTILPVVTQSIKQMIPYIPLLVQGFTALIQGVADMIKAIGPRGMEASAKIFVGLMKVMGAALTVFGKVLNFLAVAVYHTAHAIHQQWDELRHRTADAFDQIRHDVARFADWLVKSWIATGHMIESAWNAVWRNTIGATIRGIAAVIGWFKTLPGRAVAALRGFGHTLGSFASAALTEMWNGFKRIGGNILGWFSSFGKSIISVVKKVLGVFSPSSVFFDIGVNLMRGLEHGVKHGVGRAQKAAQLAAQQVANVGSGVQRWAPLVRQALAMEGLSPSLLRNVLYQMMTESGGNPNAINLTDVNARNGDPSRGLMQTIGTTFMAYHWPGTSYDIFNPLANIAAALNYARHVYGPSLMSGGMGIGSGHGYALGGVITEPIWGIGRSGRSYTFGERGPETVTPGTGRGRSVVINNYNTIVHPVDAELVSRKLAFQMDSG